MSWQRWDVKRITQLYTVHSQRLSITWKEFGESVITIVEGDVNDDEAKMKCYKYTQDEGSSVISYLFVLSSLRNRQMQA